MHLNHFDITKSPKLTSPDMILSLFLIVFSNEFIIFLVLCDRFIKTIQLKLH